MTVEVKELDLLGKRVFQIFGLWLACTPRDKWEKIIVGRVDCDDGGTYTERDFKKCVSELVLEIVHKDTDSKMQTYLLYTPKPKIMGVRDWIERVSRMNGYLPFLTADKDKFT